MNRTPDDPIEEYLDQLLLILPGSARQVRHTLSEVEAHLRDGAAAAEAEGLDEHAAAVRAVQRMGPAAGVLDDRRTRFWLTSTRRRRGVLGVLFVGAVGGLAVGAAGIIAAVVRIVGGDAAIGIPFPSGAYTQSDFTRWLAAYPSAGDCVAAMTIDHANDFLLSATVVGLGGVVCLLLLRLLRRRWGSQAVAAVAPAYVEDASNRSHSLNGANSRSMFVEALSLRIRRAIAQVCLDL